MISYILQETLGIVVNLEFNSPFRMETKKEVHQVGGCWIPISHESGQSVVWLGNKKSVLASYVRINNCAPRAFECLWWTCIFSLAILISFFNFLEAHDV